LNGPWTRRKDENVHRVLAAIGCVRPDWIESAAQSIYDSGAYDGEPGLRIRLVAIGARENPELRLAYPAVTQLTWPQVLRFIWQRFRDYRRQKTQVEQWDADGKRLKSWADRAKTPERFVEVVLDRMGVLLGYRRFGPELLMLDLVADTSTKGTFIDTKANSGIAGAGGGNKYKTIGTVLQELDPGMLDRFEALRAYMMALGDDVQETTPRFYIAFKRIKNFACVEFRPSTCQILMFVKVDPSTVQLEPGFTRDVSNLRHFGDGGLEITLSTAGDLDRAKPLIELSYGAS
jgi:predicted transport protein